MERKVFLKNVAAGGSLLLVSPALFNACSNGTDQSIKDANNNNGNSSQVTVDLTASAYSELGTVGGYAYKGDIIIIRTSDTQYVALSKICTHQGCTVMYNASSNEIPCPCHGSLYSISGNVLKGPATKSLKQYNTKLDGTTLIIS